MKISKQSAGLLLTIALSGLLSGCQQTLKPFTSDGCSSFPDGTIKQSDLWLACCTAHDRTYWQGGTYDDRLASDKELRMCVSEVGQPEIAALMLAGVRVGGSPLWPTTFRWGYGWPYPRWYGKLTDEELAQVELREAEIEEPSIELLNQ